MSEKQINSIYRQHSDIMIHSTSQQYQPDNDDDDIFSPFIQVFIAQEGCQIEQYTVWHVSLRYKCNDEQ